MILQEFSKRLALHFLTRPSISSLFHRFTRGTVTIFVLHRFGFNQHGVHGHSAEFVDECLTLLKEQGYQFISLQEVIDGIQIKRTNFYKTVCFTIDDGFEDQATIAAPIFKKHNCPLSIFLITDFLDGKLWPWDDQVRYCFSETEKTTLIIPLGDRTLTYDLAERDRTACSREFREICKTLPEEKLIAAVQKLEEESGIVITGAPPDSYKPMTWDMARTLEEQGVTFATHGISHRIIANMTRERAEQEITGSWKRISEELASPIKAFCFSTGRRGQDFTERDLSLLQTHGFTTAMSTDPLYVDSIQAGDVITKTAVLDRFAFPEEREELIQYCSGTERIKSLLRNGMGNLIKDYYGSKKGLAKHILYKLVALTGWYRKYEIIDIKKVKRLVFICKGNICRSPFAEGVAKNLGIDAISYGVDTRGGDEANEKAREIAKEFGVDMSKHRTRRIETYNPNEGDLIIGMEPAHINLLRNKINIPTTVQQLLLGSYGKISSQYIHDPYGNGDQYFRSCFGFLSSAVESMAKYYCRDMEND